MLANHEARMSLAYPNRERTRDAGTLVGHMHEATVSLSSSLSLSERAFQEPHLSLLFSKMKVFG